MLMAQKNHRLSILYKSIEAVNTFPTKIPSAFITEIEKNNSQLQMKHKKNLK